MVVVSKNNGDFSTLKEVSLTLESGKYLIYLPDSLYEENLDCNIDIKEGWILKGRGIEHTKVIFRDVHPKAHSYNINIIGSSEIRDLRLVSITTEADSRYCLHLDDHRINDLRFLCHNVMMEGIWENDNGMQDNGNMLVCGIGLWDNWNITFRNCIIKGDERIKTFRHGFGVINLHNND